MTILWQFIPTWVYVVAGVLVLMIGFVIWCLLSAVGSVQKHYDEDET